MQDLFPALDPIPLPAPVWLFVALHTLTLALHFFAVQFLVGGLTVATVWGFLGRRRRDPVLLNASGVITHRLPILMTYVINLGVPPLLFAQVLYGRALYTSSILIGVWWFSVIALLILSYSLLYVAARNEQVSRVALWAGLVALIVVLKIGVIYSTNMSLMLRPDLWNGIYRASPYGTTFGTGDAAVLPRWAFMMLGSLGISGIALLALSLKTTLAEGVSPLLVRWGGRLLAVFLVVQMGLGFLVLRAQPLPVRELLAQNTFYRICALVWFATAALLLILGIAASLRARIGVALFGVVAVVGLLNMLAMVLTRDGIRYSALRVSGFDLWDRAVSTNWSIVVLFLLVFVGALGMMGWLISVVARASKVKEHHVMETSDV